MPTPSMFFIKYSFSTSQTYFLNKQNLKSKLMRNEALPRRVKSLEGKQGGKLSVVFKGKYPSPFN